MSRGVRGPNSALTEFLRERGINASQIRQRAEQRNAQAAAEAAQAVADEAAEAEVPATSAPTRRTRRSAAGATQEVEEAVVAESSAAAAKRSNAKGKSKKRKKGDESDDEFNDALNPYKKANPVPGQIDFCAECNSRFTVTAYSKGAPGGEGLLCTACGKKVATVDKDVKKKRATGKRTKREVLRAALNGEAPGAKSLKEYCIRLVATYIDDVEALGDMGSRDMDRICQIISRNRSLTNNTLKLFTETQNDHLTLYDCARLDTASLTSIAAFVPNLRHLSLHHAGKATNETLEYYAEKLPKLTSFHIRGAFLVSRDAYVQFVTNVGPRLESLTISSTARTNPAVIEAIGKHCPNLRHLTLSHLARLDDEALTYLYPLTNLETLDISYAGTSLTDEAITKFLDHIGSSLTTLNLAGNISLSTPTIQSIHACCAALQNLDLTEVELVGNEDIKALFTNWGKNRGLHELRMSRLIELKDDALLAVAQHSGQTLEVLDVNSCHDFSKAGILEALGYCKRLRVFDAGFVRSVDDDVVRKMQDVGVTKLEVWGCTKVTECVDIAPGVSLVGREADIAA